MAIDMLVDSTELDNGLTTIADAIRAKGGTSALLAFPNGMAQAVEDIPTGITPTGNINITDTNVTDVTNYATAQVVDADLVASNIKKDVNILGIIGTFEGGGGSLPSVISKIDGGSFTVASDTSADNYPIPHILGEAPKGFFIWTENAIAETANTNRYVQSASCTVANLTSGVNTYAATATAFIQNLNGGAAHINADLKETQVSIWFNSANIKYNNSSIYYKAGITYSWLAWA